MSFNIYFHYLDIAKSQYSVEGFVRVWYDAAFLPIDVKEQLQDKIMFYLKDLGNHYGIKVTETTTFREFVETYDELMYSSQCSDSPNECLRYFARRNDLKNVKVAIKKGADNWNRGMFGGIQGGHPKIIDFFLQQKESDLNMQLYDAAKKGDFDLAESLFKKGANKVNLGLYGAVQSGNLELVRFFVENGADDWDSALYGATKMGHFILIKYFIERGADLNLGMYGAVEKDYLDLVTFFVEKGANDWNMGLYGAAKTGNLNLVKFFIEKGATDWNLGLYGAEQNNNQDLADFFVEKLRIVTTSK